jgi:hypothetical protein
VIREQHEFDHMTTSRSRRFLQIIWVSILLIISGLSSIAQTAPRDLKSVDAVRGIVAAFQQRPIVIIGEAHWLKQAGSFYVTLIHDPPFQETIQDIVVEFASQNNQPLLDRYIAGEDVPLEDVRHIWRDTTKVASWESPIYAEWLASIREVNTTLPPARRLRVLAGDTAVDWSRIHTHSDWAALGDNNITIASVILDEVLKKKHRALVVLGSNHVIKSGGRDGADNTTTRIESRYPGSTFVALLDYRGLLGRSTQDKIRSLDHNLPTLHVLAGTDLGNAPSQAGLPLIKVADALLFLGPLDTLTLAPPGPGSLETAYLNEIDRRSMIEWGELRARRFLGPAAQ